MDREQGEAALRVLHQVSQPGHGLVSALTLEDVQQEVWLAGAAEEVTNLIMSVELLQLIQNLLRRSPQWPVRVESNDGGQQEAALLCDQLLGGGRSQLRFKLQNLLLLQLAHLRWDEMTVEVE